MAPPGGSSGGSRIDGWIPCTPDSALVDPGIARRTWPYRTLTPTVCKGNGRVLSWFSKQIEQPGILLFTPKLCDIRRIFSPLQSRKFIDPTAIHCRTCGNGGFVLWKCHCRLVPQNRVKCSLVRASIPSFTTTFCFLLFHLGVQFVCTETMETETGTNLNFLFFDREFQIRPYLVPPIPSPDPFKNQRTYCPSQE